MTDWIFQSTLPTRGSDDLDTKGFKAKLSISIHAPHEGERRLQALALAIIIDISIHAPHEGERRCCPGAARTVDRFQSTLPTRGSDPNATRPASRQSGSQSTLPTRGSDYLSTDDPVLMPDFNPRSPRGGATMRRPTYVSGLSKFQSTLPTRGSDVTIWKSLLKLPISIHAPHEGERPTADICRANRLLNFNPRSPRGGATNIMA